MNTLVIMNNEQTMSSLEIEDFIEEEQKKLTSDIRREKEENNGGKYRYTLTITPRGKVWLDKQHD